MNNRQKETLIGMILGDGCLEKNGSMARLRVDHSDKQKEYVEWKYSIFANLAAKNPRMVKVYDRRTNKIYTHWRFDTITTEEFVDYKRIFYNRSRKIIPKNIDRILISKLSLAVWFMDDGYNRKDCRGLHLNTQAYSLKEHEKLQSCLKRNYGITTTLHRQRNKHKLYIPSWQSEEFMELIQPHVLPSMAYKLL